MRRDPKETARSGPPEQDSDQSAASGTTVESNLSGQGKGQGGIDQLLTDFLSELNQISGTGSIGHSESKPVPHPVAPEATLSPHTNPGSAKDKVPDFLKLISDIQTEHLAQGKIIVAPEYPASEAKCASDTRPQQENAKPQPSDSASTKSNEKRGAGGDPGGHSLRREPELSREPDPELAKILDLLERKQAKILRKHAGLALDRHISGGQKKGKATDPGAWKTINRRDRKTGAGSDAAPVHLLLTGSLSNSQESRKTAFLCLALLTCAIAVFAIRYFWISGVSLRAQGPPPAATMPASATRYTQPGEKNPAPVSKPASPPIPAKAIEKVDPKYPLTFGNLRTNDTVVLEADVDETGKVTGAHAISGLAMLRSPAEEAVRKWRFSPATINGVNVRSTIQVSVVFKN